MRLFRKSADMISSPIDNAICAVTSPDRKRAAARPPAICPAPARMALIRSLRVLCIAGKSPKMIPVAILKAAEKRITALLMVKCIVSEAAGGSSALMTLSVHCATSSDAIPPTSASITLSVSNCVTRFLRVAPRARRTPISVARPAPRASSRFAMLAHAIRSTTPVTENSSMMGVFASLLMELCPRLPGTRTSFLFLKLSIVLSLIDFWSGASTSVMIGWYTALAAGAADSIVMPGFRRAKR